jgi:outer membrane protein assembly factor BamA
MKMIKQTAFLFFLILIFIIGTNSYAQSVYKLQIRTSNPEAQVVVDKLKYDKSYRTVNDRKKGLDDIMMQLYAMSYVAASIDSSIDRDNTLEVFMSLNQKYQWKYLGRGNLSELIIEDIGFNEKEYQGANFNYQHLIAIQESIIAYYENHGYPFASIGLDSIRFQNQEVSAVFNINQGPLFHIDTIQLSGYTDIHPNYIYRLIDIKPHDIYIEHKIENIEKQLSSMSFARESKALQIVFEPEKAGIHIQLEKSKSNIFDGIIGFQPNSAADNKLMLTGNLRLKLINSFKRGETIGLNWRSPGNGSQNIDLEFAYPYIFNSPLGVDYKFQLFKQDSNFINIRNIPGIRFIINGSDYVKLSADLFSSSVLSKSLINGIPTNSNILDMKSSLFSLEANFVHLDYIFNPRKGWLLNLSGGYGTKKIIKQHDIDPSFYDSIPINSNQLKLSAHLEYFIPLFKRQTLRLANKSELLQGDYLLSNELFRIGGFSDLRGFNEEQIYASTYSIFTFEWRLLLERNSYLNVFWNGAYVENSTGSTTTYDQPMGFGAGLSFETKAGIFALSYALGRQQGNPIEFNSAKIHFGYTARF